MERADDLVLNIVTFELTLRQTYRDVQLDTERYKRNSHLPGVREGSVWENPSNQCWPPY